MEGIRQAKYRNSVVDMVFWIVLLPKIPENKQRKQLNNILELLVDMIFRTPFYQ